MSIEGLNILSTGINDAQLRINAASHDIAALNAETPVRLSEVSSSARPEGQGVSSLVGSRESVFGVDLVSEALNLKLGQMAFEAGAAAFKSTNEVFGTLMDIVDTDSKDD
jgi:flagellar hook-associated protein FlgK